MTDFKAKTVLITGGAQGLGKLLAIRAVDRGARVILWDINKEELEATVGELGDSAAGYIVDITDRQQVYEISAEVEEQWGTVDILMNNAGIVSGEDFMDLSDEEIERTFAVNSLSLFWMTRAFLPGMLAQQDGHIVTIASAAGMIGVDKLGDYCASKFAAVGFDESLRVAMKKDETGVETTVVCPYFIDTGMFDGVKTRFSWLLPILKEEDVADKVIGAVEKNRARLMMPWAVHFLPLLRILPTGLFDWAMTFLGVNESMDDFHGHGDGEVSRAEKKSGVTASQSSEEPESWVH